MQDNGKIEYVWQGKNGKYFALISYWIGTGFQRVEREISEPVFNAVDSGVL